MSLSIATAQAAVFALGCELRDLNLFGVPELPVRDGGRLDAVRELVRTAEVPWQRHMLCELFRAAIWGRTLNPKRAGGAR